MENKITFLEQTKHDRSTLEKLTMSFLDSFHNRPFELQALKVETTDRKLENLTWKVERWERAVSQASLAEVESSPQQESEQESCVLNLLQDVTQVREDYEQLRSDITEIQQLQKELTECLRVQLQNMHVKYGFLRSKLGPALPSCLMMSANSYQPSPAKHPAMGRRNNSQ